MGDAVVTLAWIIPVFETCWTDKVTVPAELAFVVLRLDWFVLPDCANCVKL